MVRLMRGAPPQWTAFHFVAVALTVVMVWVGPDWYAAAFGVIVGTSAAADAARTQRERLLCRTEDLVVIANSALRGARDMKLLLYVLEHMTRTELPLENRPLAADVCAIALVEQFPWLRVDSVPAPDLARAHMRAVCHGHRRRQRVERLPAGTWGRFAEMARPQPEWTAEAIKKVIAEAGSVGQPVPGSGLSCD